MSGKTRYGDFARKLRLKNQEEWNQYSKKSRPKYISSGPRETYKEEWRGFKDWLGNN